MQTNIAATAPGLAAWPSATAARWASASPLLRAAARLAMLVALALALQALVAPMIDGLGAGMAERRCAMTDPLTLLLALAYVLAMALPFVPGIEIGLAIILVLGPGSIVVVYACTQAALWLSFAVGRLLPRDKLALLLRWLEPRSATGVRALANPLPTEAGAGLALRGARGRWLARLARHRYLALAVLVNLPGNAVIGGAGGIGLAAGMSRAYSLPRYLLAMALATTPVPVALWVCGMP